MLTKEQFTKKVAQNIKEARESKRMSQEELADSAKLYRTYIGHLENGRYSPSAYVLYKIANALNMKTNSLIEQ